MKSIKLFVALFAASSAFAGEVPAAPAAAAASVAVQSLNVPVVSIAKEGQRSREDVKAEAVEFVKNHKTAFAIQLEQYK